MDAHRRTAVAASAVVAVVLSMLCACTTGGAATTHLGSLPGATPSNLPVATVIPTATGLPDTAPPPPVTTHRATHTATATATVTPPSPSSSPSSADPGDYSIAKGTSNASFFCAWHDAGNGIYEVYADFTTYYRGPQHPASVPYRVLNSVNDDIAGGSTAPNETDVFGVKLRPAAQKYTLTLTVYLFVGVDDRPSDDSASFQIQVPAGSPPPGNVTVGLACG